MATTGTYGNATLGAGGRTLGTGTLHGGFQFTAPATGTVTQAKLDSDAGTSAASWTLAIYTNNAGSPGTQVGVASNALSITTSGAQTFTFGTPPSITNGTVYWLVMVNAGSNTWVIDTCSNDASYGSGRNDTITAITTTGLPSSEDFRVEITYAATAAAVVGGSRLLLGVGT